MRSCFSLGTVFQQLTTALASYLGREQPQPSNTLPVSNRRGQIIRVDVTRLAMLDLLTCGLPAGLPGRSTTKTSAYQKKRQGSDGMITEQFYNLIMDLKPARFTRGYLFRLEIARLSVQSC